MEEAFELRRLSLGFDWTVRPAMQARLSALAGTVDVSTEAGCAAALAAMRSLVGDHASGLVAGFALHEKVAPDAAGERFGQWADDLRGRFEVETHRNAARTEVSLADPKPEEGEGYLMLSLLVGLEVAGDALPSVTDRASALAALNAIAPKDGRGVAALEVFWSPTMERDRMSPTEMAEKYPEVTRLADVGPLALGPERR